MKKLLKKDADIFLGYENVEPQPIPQMTPNKFLSICRVIYDSWRERSSDNWYQYDDNVSDEKLYCHFKMMGIDETAWYGKEKLMDSYIYGSLTKPGYYVGGYHFEEIAFGGIEHQLRPIDMEKGSCIMELSDRLRFDVIDPYGGDLVEIILAYNACIKNGYYVQLHDKEQIISCVRKIYDSI